MDPRLAVFLILGVAAVPAYADSHERQAYQKSVEVSISETGDVHVKHVAGGADEPRQLALVGGERDGILVLDQKGNKVAFTVLEGGGRIVVAPSEEDVVVEYELVDQLIEKDGIWTLDFDYGQTTAFMMPDVDLVFVNGNPVYLEGRDGIACHGCNVLLEYATEWPKILENVVWNEGEFPVEIRTAGGFGQLEFDQPGKNISFNVTGGDKFVIIIFPVELLGGPYHMFLDGERADFKQFNNGTHAWLSARPETGGSMEVVGTTVIPEFPLTVMLVAGIVMSVGVGIAKISSRNSIMLR